VHFTKVDIRNYAEVDKATQAAADLFGKIDILINNAGITSDSTLKKMEPEQWQKVLDVNLTGVFNCGKAVSLRMMEHTGGRIINTSSVVALYGNFGQSNYVATKAGVIGLTKVWARELGRYQITVNAVAPGFIETDMIKTVPEKVLETLRGKSPLGRMGYPEEIANAYLFLASEKAAFITGTVISVDGGLTI
jgi:3-oxoacyl-[acyl-carrier protein] reductase